MVHNFFNNPVEFMKITVLVKTNKKENRVEKIDNNNFVVFTKEPPKENKANLDVIFQLSEFFMVPESYIILVSGKTFKTKVFDIKI